MKEAMTNVDDAVQSPPTPRDEEPALARATRPRPRT